MTTGVIATSPILQFFLNNGQLAVGGSILTQVGGLNTTTYQDSGLTTPLPNPIPLNSRGEISNAAGASSQLFLIPNVVYTFTLFDANNNQVWVASYVNGVQVAITQSIVGNALYPQTTSETAAGATIVSFQYPPLNILRYGTNSIPGVTDMTSAMQTAINVAIALGGGAVYVPSGSYAIKSAVGGTLIVPLRIYGDGAGCTNIIQPNDANVFSFVLTVLTSRLIVEELRITPAFGSPMTNGRAISVFGEPGIFPPRALTIQNVVILGSGTTDEFRYCIFANGICNAYIAGIEFHGNQTTTSTTSVGIHIESTPGGNQSTAWDIVTPQLYSFNIGIEIATSVKPGVEGIIVTGGSIVGVNFGFKANNSLGLGTYAPPQIGLIGSHINSNNNCVDITSYVDVFIKDCYMIRLGSNTGSFIAFSAVQNFVIEAICTVGGTTDVPVLSMAGSLSPCANGEMTGFFQGQASSTNRVVTATGSISVVRVRGEMNAYAGWIPPVSSPGYTGTLLCNPSDVIPLTSDEISVTITPSGGVAGGGTIDLSFVQAPYVILNATAGTITGITPYGGTGAQYAKRVTFECDTSGVVIQHNANQLMPGGVNFTYVAGATIDLYHFSPTVWRAVGRQ